MNLQVGPAVRGLEIKVMSFANEVWSEAQARVSKFEGSVTHKEIQGSYRLFTIAEKREAQTKNGGIVATPRANQEFSRRALFTRTFHDAIAIDRDDEVDNQVDIMMSSKDQMTNAFARTRDRVILHSLVDPVSETNDSAAEAGTNLVTASISLNKRYRGNAWAKVEGATGTTTPLPAITADDLEYIAYIFATRDVEGSIHATLTPELKLQLRKDADFKNAENIYSRSQEGSGIAGGAPIHYKDVDFITTSKSVLPLISNANIGNSAAGNRNKAQAIAVRSLTQADELATVEAHLSGNLVTKATLKTELNALDGVTGIQTAAVTCKSTDVAYFWDPSALYYAKRDSLTFGRLSELPEQSHARQLYMRVNYGAMIIEDAFCLTVPVKGTVTTALS